MQKKVMNDLEDVIIDSEAATQERVKRKQDKYAHSTRNQKQDKTIVFKDRSEDSSQVSSIAARSLPNNNHGYLAKVRVKQMIKEPGQIQDALI